MENLEEMDKFLENPFKTEPGKNRKYKQTKTHSNQIDKN